VRKLSELEVIDAGAWDIFKKPIELSELSVVLKRALKVQGLVKQNLNMKQAGQEKSDLNIIGACPAIEKVRELIRQVAVTDATILIQGESGAGKELIAQAIHSNSNRASRQFIAVNCAALSESILEDELFGHESGAYTGAKGGRKGKFELADKGTLFLDEIAELSPSAQGKLLRVLQEGTLERLGGERTISVDVRLIAATHQNLQEKVKNGKFREDLFYRINVIPIHTPALKDRGDDIEVLANHFLSEFRRKMNTGPTSIDEQAMSILKSYSWQGNVRELRNMIERLVILTKSQTIREQDIPHEFKREKITQNGHSEIELNEDVGYEDLVNQYRKKLIEQVLSEESSKSEVAKRLKINRSYLYELIEKLEIKNI
jgi:DNA-binding NtrC family response regulator